MLKDEFRHWMDTVATHLEAVHGVPFSEIVLDKITREKTEVTRSSWASIMKKANEDIPANKEAVKKKKEAEERTKRGLEAGHLFDSSVTSIGFRKGTYLRGYMYDFISGFAPHLSRDVVDEVMAMPSKEAQERFFKTLELPTL